MSDFLILKNPGFHAKWRLKNESSNSILMMYKYNYPDLGSHHYGIYALVSQKKQTNKQTNEQTKTRKKKQLNWKKKKKWETSRDVASFSAQANINWTLHVLSHAPANSGWRSDGQILDLKQHVHGVVKLDSLTVGQAKHLVVIQNSVHVFDPQSVYRSVTHNPLVIFSGVLRGDS